MAGIQDTKQYQITQLVDNNDNLLLLHPETDADIVKYDNTGSTLQATEVQSAIDEIDAKVEGLDTGVTGVKGNAESTYRTGNVNITKANIGLGNVTDDAQVKGLANGTTENDIVVWGANGYAVKDGGAVISTATPTSSSTDAQVPTSKAVWSAISSLPTPMQFKGTVGTGGTIEWSALPTASSSTGFTYKVITDHATTPVCKNGDTIVSNGSSWIVIPSGDEPSGTVTSVGMTVPTGLSVSGSPITSSGTLAITYASDYSIPTNTKQSQWDAKYNLPSGGIPKTDLASAVQTSLGKADSALQENQTITISGDASGSGKTAITLTLANTGVTADTYSAVTVNAKGLVTAGGQIVEVGATNQATPSSALAVGGLFFKEV